MTSLAYESIRTAVDCRISLLTMRVPRITGIGTGVAYSERTISTYLKITFSAPSPTVRQSSPFTM